jgi:hypothetical protein
MVFIIKCNLTYQVPIICKKYIHCLWLYHNHNKMGSECIACASVKMCEFDYIRNKKEGHWKSSLINYSIICIHQPLNILDRIPLRVSTSLGSFDKLNSPERLLCLINTETTVTTHTIRPSQTRVYYFHFWFKTLRL